MQVKGVRYCVPLTLLALLLLTGALLGQDYDPNAYTKPKEDKGPTASLLISGSSNNINGMLKYDGSVGWNFTRNFGFDVGVPFLFDMRPGLFTSASGQTGYVNTATSGCTYFYGCYTGVRTGRLWTGELADAYAEIHYTRTYRKYDFLTNLTGDAPTASYRKGMTTGRAQWDWFNHIDTNVHGFDPFVNFGLANGRMDQHFLPRPFDTNLPFRTLGYMADFEGGLQYKVFRRVTIGASVWDILPMGPQRIYSNLVWEQPNESILQIGSPYGGTGVGMTGYPVNTGSTGNTGTMGNTGSTQTGTGNTSTTATFVSQQPFGFSAGPPNYGRYWDSAFETIGPSYIDRDNGYSATLTFSPIRFMDVEIGYNRSVRYRLDEAVVTVAFNANAVFRKLTNY